MTDTQTHIINGLVVVQPALEPWPSVMRKVGPVAVFLYARWSCFAIGVDVMRAGFAVHIGPFMIGLCHIQRQRAAFESESAS